MILLSLTSAAFATPPTTDPAPACFATAETAYPSASIEVIVNGVQVVAPTSDLDSVFAGVASASNDATVSLTRNTDGTAAIRQAMDCIFDAEAITWSAVRLNQQVPELQVRTGGGMHYLLNGQDAVLNTVSVQGDALTPLIVFEDSDPAHQSCLTAGLTAVFRTGTADLWWSATAGPVLPGQTCSGVDCRKCAFEETGDGCKPCIHADPPDAEDAHCNHTTTTGPPKVDTSVILTWSP